MSEEQLQAECFQWFTQNFYPDERRMLFHVNNKSKNKIEGNKMKAKGVVRGPSDFIFIGYGKVSFIEMKLPGETQLPDQIDFQQQVEKRGHKYSLCYSFEEFKKLIYFLIKN